MKIKWPKLFQRKTKPRYQYDRTLHSTSTDFLHHEYFSGMNKTDYTYSRSPSYRRKANSSTYQIPNMARRNLRGGKGGTMEEGDLYISDDEEEEEAGRRVVQARRVTQNYSAYDSDEEYGYRDKTVIEDGLHLRSGTSLTSERSIKEKFMTRNRRSIPATSSSHKSQVSKQASYKDRRSQGVLSDVRSRSQVSSSSSSNTDVRLGTQASSRSSRSVNIRKDLMEEFVEKGMIENRETKDKNGRFIRHGFGLEPAESEYSGVESDSDSQYKDKYSSSSMSTYTNDRRSRSSDMTDDSSSALVTTVTTTVITTIYETVVFSTRPVVEPVWNNIGEPVWRYTGQPVWHYVGQPLWQYIAHPVLSTATNSLAYIISTMYFVLWTSLLQSFTSSILSTASWLYSSFTHIIMQMVVLESWIMFRRSRFCCLCFPLLLLLPLLFVFVVPYLSGDLFRNVFDISYFQVPKITAVDGLTSLSLQEEVKRIVIHLQKQESEGLGTADVEKIVRGILAQELTNLKQTHQEDKNQQELLFMQFSQDQNLKLEALQSSLIKNISDIEAKLERELNNMNVNGQDSTERSAVLIGQLQEDLSVMRSQLQTVELSQQTLDLQMKNCCKNESYYNTLIHDKVSRILGQVMMSPSSGNKEQDAFAAWLHGHYVSRKDLDDRLHTFAADLTSQIMEEVKKHGGTEVFISDSSGGSGISEMVVRKIVDEALTKFNADKIGLPDFALESAGGSVISTRCSETYHKKTAQYSIMGIPLWYVSNSPRTVIQPEVHPGSCWAFQGDRGYLVIELSTMITPTGFSMEHIPKSLAPNGKIDSAPKDFMVLGLSGEQDTIGTNLGNYTYNKDGEPLQFFKVQKQDVGSFKLVELRILKNHGNSIFTCLYRFRVHGTPNNPL